MPVSEVPKYSDFEDVGLDYLHLSWTQIVNLLIDLENGLSYSDEEIETDYWKSARQIILTSLTLSQQGVEMILKGFIAKTSPYLLLQSPHENIKKSKNNSDLKFSDFRTIDAQDAPRMVKAFTNITLTDNFIQIYNTLRNHRNKIAHTTAADINIEKGYVISSILEIFHQLYPKRHWPNERVKFLEKQPISQLDGGDTTINMLLWETELGSRLIKLDPEAHRGQFDHGHEIA